ncbi:sensor domain-containing diguanylate cyclase [Polyangium sp. 15x6]|uniref:sensor domain-containing diguanylate cyclase n=1 Tax=Polyangium sp. 15x6 TaxID=3042687 RepID=UPI00249AC315|nr:sensor domain-containing diguanylate cyclase [Polyangium sp. 15x6]MDI3284890.1 sensor domain-containing diguanylate cyclase [Polyangium sp. 15x6]
MAPLVVLVLKLRRLGRAALPLTAAIALGAVVVASTASPLSLWIEAPASALLLGLLAARASRRSRAIEGTLRLDLEVGTLLTVLVYAIVTRSDGALDGRLYPLVYVCVGLVSAFARPIATVLILAFALGLDASVRHWAMVASSFERLAYSGAFMVVFASFNALLLRAEIARARSALKERIQAEVEKLRDDARSYRLLGAPAGGRNASRANDEERLVRSGVEEIHQSVLFALRLLRQAMNLHTAVLLWQNDAGTHLRISELSTDDPNVAEGPFLAGDGIFGAAITQREAVALRGLEPRHKLPYYTGPCPVRAALALPVFEHGAIRGVLVLDRIADEPFGLKEQELAMEACRYAVRAIQNERVFVQLERAKVEQGRLYRAVESLNAATTEAEVVEAGLRTAREITSVDFAAVTLYDESQKAHEIRAVSGGDEANLVGQQYKKNAGLVSMALENKHPLPYRGEYDEKRQIVFTKKLAPPSMPSMIVLPMLVHDKPLGTLVLGSRRRAAFGDAARSTLEVLTSHVAVSLANARMMRRLEEMATLDGMTGLYNKRAMLEIADQKIKAAKRFGRKLSVLVTDIDHFKKVNDTYGHDAGDVIIKGLGEVLRRERRATDATARFGGEEFVVICEETDARGAMLLAERVREELGKTIFHAPKPGPDGQPVTIRVTCSIGVASFPEAGETWDDLFKAADEALYASKRGGRNRVTAHASLPTRAAGSKAQHAA